MNCATILAAAAVLIVANQVECGELYQKRMDESGSVTYAYFGYYHEEEGRVSTSRMMEVNRHSRNGSMSEQGQAPARHARQTEDQSDSSAAPDRQGKTCSIRLCEQRIYSGRCVTPSGSDIAYCEGIDSIYVEPFNQDCESSDTPSRR